MSITPHPGRRLSGVSPGSVPTLASHLRPAPPSNPAGASKRVCFYKSGDPQFAGLRLVINGRTFKTFDALLDALSKKVPLPFGVRTITTPRGTNSIRALDELQDGGSYVCSDQKRTKPLNLEQVNRRQVPWNATRPISTRRGGPRRPFPRRLDMGSRVERMTDRTVVVRTPKRLVIYKNRDPMVKRILVLHKRTAPTFDALLDYLSQAMQFPVVKLFTTDGARVEGLAGLILCSGVVVAAGNEPFRPTNFHFQRRAVPSQAFLPAERTQEPPQIYKKKSPTNSTRSRNFSLSSERYFVNQIKKSLSGSLSEHESHHSASLDAELTRPSKTGEEFSHKNQGVAARDCPVMPTEDDIEKSFRVNQDGSMTVEMKVRLTVKQEELIHWTTTLSRTSVMCQQMELCNTQPMSGANSPDVSHDFSRDRNGPSADPVPYERREDSGAERAVTFKEQEGAYDSCGSKETDRSPRISKRTATPRNRHTKCHSASMENLMTVAETEVRESTVGTYSYMERTSEGELTEGYCVVSRSSTSNIRPVPKPRKTGSADKSFTDSQSPTMASAIAETLQFQDQGSKITETVMHIYESEPQGSIDNYLANLQYGFQNGGSPNGSPTQLGFLNARQYTPNNDCDVDLTRLSTASGSHDGKEDEIFSLSSGSRTRTTLNTGNAEKSEQDFAMPTEAIKKKGARGTKTRSGSSSTPQIPHALSSGSDQRKETFLSGCSKSSQTKTVSFRGAKTKSSSGSAQTKGIGKMRKSEKDSGTRISGSKSSISAVSAEQGRHSDDSAVRDLPQNLNYAESEKQTNSLPKSDPVVSQCLPTGFSIKTVLKQKSMSDDRVRSPRQHKELCESVSLPLLCSPPTIQQYVETWLQQIQPNSFPYMEDINSTETETETEKDVLKVDTELSKESVLRSASEIISEEESKLPKEDKSLERLEQEHASRGGQLLEPQGVRGFCKSMPSVRIEPADHDAQSRMHKSTEVLFPLDSQSSPEETEENSDMAMAPVLQQLCLSLQSIRRKVFPTQSDSLEKARSLPDFSGQVASVFGASSTKLFSFLSVMTLKDGSSCQEPEFSLSGGTGSYSEALKVMQSLEKIAGTGDEEELRASLSDLRNSTSSKFQLSWKNFRDKYDIDENPLPSPKHSEQEFILDIHSEAGEQNKTFDVEQLVGELSISEELRQEISSLAEGELIYHAAKDPFTRTTDTAATNAKHVIENSELVEVMSIAKLKAGKKTTNTDQGSDDESLKRSWGDHEGSDEDNGSEGTESPLGPPNDSPHIGSEEEESLAKESMSEVEEVASNPSDESVSTTRGSPVGAEAPLDKVERYSPNIASYAKPPSEPRPSDEELTQLVSHQTPPPQQQVSETAHHECDIVTPHPQQLGRASRSEHGCSGGEIGEGEGVPNIRPSSCLHSVVSAFKTNEDGCSEAKTEDEEITCADPPINQTPQKDNKASSLHVLDTKRLPESPKHSVSERKSVTSAESTLSIRNKNSTKGRKSIPSEKSSARSSTSSITVTRKALSSADALHLGIATSRLYSPVGRSSQNSLSPKRKTLTPKIPNHVKKVTTRPKSLTGETLQAQQEILSESVSMPFLCAPPTDVHQYVGNWLEKMQPEDSIAKREGDVGSLGQQKKTMFKLGASSSEFTEGMSEEDSYAGEDRDDKSVDGDYVEGKEELEEEHMSGEESNYEAPQITPYVQIQCDGELIEDSIPQKKNFCRSMPSVRVHPIDQDCHMRMHKSTENLCPPNCEVSSEKGVLIGSKGGMRPVLEQLCLSLQSIKRAGLAMGPTSLEKAKSLPNFSAQVASVFGGSSSKLLSFLSVMTLKDGSSDQGSPDTLNSYPEALQVIQCLEKLTNTEDEKELRDSLSDLRNSTSSKFKESWRDFQEKYDIEDTPLESPRSADKEFALAVSSEASDLNKDSTYGIEELMEKLNMSEDLRQEISSLVEGDIYHHKSAELNQSSEDLANTNPITGPDDMAEVEMLERSGEGCTESFSEDNLGELERDGPESGESASSSEHGSCSDENESLKETEQIETHDSDNSKVQDMTADGCTDSLEEANSFAKDSVDILDKSQSDTAGSVTSAEERSVPRSNSKQCSKHEETGSEDIDSERFRTPATDPDGRDVESGCGLASDTDHQPEEAKCESSHEDTSTEDNGSYGDSNAEIKNISTHNPDHINQVKCVNSAETDHEEPIESDETERQDHLNYIETKRAGEIHSDGTDNNNETHVNSKESINDENPIKNEDVHSDRTSEGVKSWSDSPDSENPSGKGDNIFSNESDEEDPGPGDEYTREVHTFCENSEGNFEGKDDHLEKRQNINNMDPQGGKLTLGDDELTHGDDEDDQTIHCKDSDQEEYIRGSPANGDNFEEEQNDSPPKQNALMETERGSQQSSQSHRSLDRSKETCINSTNVEDDQLNPQCYGIVHPVDISKELLDFVNKALLSSSLTFTYDSNGNLRIQPGIGERRYISELLHTKANVEGLYGLKRLPSPNTSDLSDYRPETADSGEQKSQLSFELSSDLGEEEAQEARVQGQDSNISENNVITSKEYITENDSLRSDSEKRSSIAPQSERKSLYSLNSNHDSLCRSSQDLAGLHTSSSPNGDSESVRCLSFYSQTDLREGVLIDKGRWLLKENHLIRTSPPVSMGMYGHMESSSADSGQESTSEVVAPSQYLNHQSPLAVISSSELEEMAKPPTPKCTYFTIPHSSDSDPFVDERSSNGSRKGELMRGNRISPQEVPPKACRTNNSFSSFTSVDLKLPDGRVHPERGGTVEQPARSQNVANRILEEEDSTESIQLRCGPNCPIL